MRIPRIMVIAVTLALWLGAFSIVVGQSLGGTGGTVKDPKSGRDPSSAPRPRNPTVKTVYKTRVERVMFTPTTGSLSVAAPSNATVLVEPIKIRNSQGQQGIVPSGEGVFVFNALKPGSYRVAGTLAGHHPEETQVIIAPNKFQSATLNFRPILYSVIINTNVSAGQLKYAPEGQPLNKVVPIQNRSVKLDLPGGKYEIEIIPADFEYETLRHTFSLTADKMVFDVPLKRIVFTTDTLSPTWTSAELQAWDIPAGWRADSKKLSVKGPGVMLPREESYRHYKDFKLSSSVKMLNGFALSFALRARDSQNYYLLQLTGEKSDEPYTVRLFVVKNGVEQRIPGARSIPRDGRKAMGAGQFFAVAIKMIGYAITVEIEDSETGAPYPLGVLTDPAHNFAAGAVGIAGRQNEENVIERFVVCAGKCLSE